MAVGSVVRSSTSLPTFEATSGLNHTVKAGETLTGIARQYSVSLEEVLAANPAIRNPNAINVGQRVNIPQPAPTSQPAVAVPATTSPSATWDTTRTRADVPARPATTRSGGDMRARVESTLAPPTSWDQVRNGQPLKRGHTGPLVTEMQQRLTKVGFGVQATGTFGPTTESVVKNFQAAQGLTADGIFGKNSLAALERLEQTQNGGVTEPTPPPRTPSPPSGPIPLHDGNSMRPGSAASAAPVANLSSLAAKGYRLKPIKDVRVLNSVAAQSPDTSLNQQRVGTGGFDLVTNGGFYFSSNGGLYAAGAVVRNGVLDTAGVEKANHRGGLAVLQNGTIVVGRQDGANLSELQTRFGSASPLKEFMGGGALLIEDSKKIDHQDLLNKQRFDQGGGGINAQQMRRTNHVVIGIRDGQAFVVGANNKTGAEIQNDLLAAGFDAAVKFDGGSGSYFRDAGGQYYGGSNPLGLGFHLRS